MKYAVAATVLTALVAQAAPLVKKAISDTDILQYALTLEHLENVFYSQALAKFSDQDFCDAGFPDWVRGRVSQIGEHEANHVALLSGALGSAATQPCTYDFTAAMASPQAFLSTAVLIENVGVSAYLGAASYITEPAYVTVAGSILTTEARHQGWLNSAVEKHSAWSGPEDTPLDFSEVYTIAAGFISSCPQSNPTLPVQAFPALAIASDGTITTTVSTDNTYVQLISGLATQTYPVVGGKVQGLPQPQGISYAVLTTSSNDTQVADSNIVAGPMILNYPFDSKVSNPAPSF